MAEALFTLKKAEPLFIHKRAEPLFILGKGGGGGRPTLHPRRGGGGQSLSKCTEGEGRGRASLHSGRGGGARYIASLHSKGGTVPRFSMCLYLT